MASLWVAGNELRDDIVIGSQRAEGAGIVQTHNQVIRAIRCATSIFVVVHHSCLLGYVAQRDVHDRTVKWMRHAAVAVRGVKVKEYPRISRRDWRYGVADLERRFRVEIVEAINAVCNRVLATRRI